MSVIGYARVSTTEQTLDLQKDALHAAGVEIIYADIASGKNAERPELQQCLKALRADDVLVVWRLDRLGRNLSDLIRLVQDLESRSVKFRSLKESIDTSVPAGKLVFHLFASLAEFERELLRERTKAGLEAARARGRCGGRPQVLGAKQIQSAMTLMESRTIAVKDIAQQFGVSRSTLYALQKQTKLLSA